ncbi:NADH:ubiquinone oxidoreductase subunit NDUFA12 [Telmatospirillum sp. J64-1]|uniref:NADH:ubiquinone oxidoreductase subunit NDUFA12 n=1 Tax=Telmatospirillum sp. J64-1 TaxID=2502183 RepID=UPI00115F71CE|nr:NADH:ubiquinone oxidoreductase subunit NDUFA12 [Telmatospirillum sp. J64-1]
MSIGTRLFTWIKGQLVGTDSLGNRYYTERHAPKGRRPKRWVVFAGEAEASTVPPEWHAWLHYTTEHPLTEKAAKAAEWQKPHVPNLTGTPAAYLPPGHDLRGGQRERSAADYEAWRP